MPSWRRVFTSEEARIESKAGASPPERKRRVLTDAEREDVLLQMEHLRAEPRWPAGMPSPPPFPADDEDDEAPDA